MANKSGIHIKESHKGLLTKKAKSAGMGTQAFAKKEEHNKNASPATRKQAVFAVNASKWSKK